MSTGEEKQKLSTLIQHPPAIDLAEDNYTLVSPIYQSVKYYFDDYQGAEDLFWGKREGYLYNRIANPTVRQLERLLAQLQGSEEGLALASGNAAISGTLMSLLKKNDHVVLFYETYLPTRCFIRDTLGKFGVHCTIIGVDQKEAYEKAFIAGKTKAVFFESPTNPMLKLIDIEKISKLARRMGALSILDNTFAGFSNHRDCGVDLYVHSLTKFAIGHGDAMGGAILGKKELIDQIRKTTIELGAVLDPDAANRCLRGLKTFYLRFDKQKEIATDLANFLFSHNSISNFSYPGHSSHPQFELVQKQMKNPGSVMAFDVGSKKEDMIKFLNRLKLIKLTGSLGATETLIAPCELFYARDLNETEKSLSSIRANTVRLAVGLEDPTDLISDLETALS